MRARLNLAVSATVAGLALALVAGDASAQTLYFDTNGTTAGSGVTSAGSYSWESPFWNTTADGTTTTPAAWTEGGAANFAAGTDAGTSNYTVTANADHSVASISILTSGGGTVTLGGTGKFTLGAGDHAMNVQTAAQSLVINSVLQGSGSISLHRSGSLSLLGSNTYTGGTTSTGGQIFFYNNSNSFGTGAITFTGTSGQGMVNNSATGYTIANPLIFTSTTTSTTNWVSQSTAGAPGALYSGAITLPATGTTTLKAGNAASDISEFTGAISGAGNLAFTGPGKILLGGNSTGYTGATTSSTQLQFAINNALPNTKSLTLGGGTLFLNGFSENMSAAPLIFTGTTVTTIDFGTLGGNTLRFADSSTQTWTGTSLLNFVNFNPTVDAIFFGSSNAALTAAQLAKIEFNGANPGTAFLDATGKLTLPAASGPEPASLLLLAVGATLAPTLRRRLRPA